jgi:hypothetical protein
MRIGLQRFVSIGLPISLLALSACTTTLLPQSQSGPSPAVRLSPTYEPFHPEDGSPVTLRVKATSPLSGILSIKLFVYEHEVIAGASGALSAQRRPGGLWGPVHETSYPARPHCATTKVVLKKGFPPNSYIRYVATVVDGTTRQTTEEWFFAAGTWPQEVPVPLWVQGPLSHRINVSFVADTDSYSIARQMLPRARALIFDGYHHNNGIRLGKKYWQFFYWQEQGHMPDYNDCVSSCDVQLPDALTQSTFSDAIGVLHTRPKRDWRAGKLFSTEPWNQGTALHETGHAVFNLADEYAGGAFFPDSDNTHHNVHEDQSACESYSETAGFEASECQPILNTTWWRSEACENACIMHDDGDMSMPSFGRSCMKKIQAYYEQLEAAQ